MYIISENSKPIQTVSIAVYLLIPSGFLFSFLADKNIFTFILLLCSIGLVIYMNIVYSKQFDINFPFVRCLRLKKSNGSVFY